MDLLLKKAGPSFPYDVSVSDLFKEDGLDDFGGFTFQDTPIKRATIHADKSHKEACQQLKDEINVLRECFTNSGFIVDGKTIEDVHEQNF